MSIYTIDGHGYGLRHGHLGQYKSGGFPIDDNGERLGVFWPLTYSVEHSPINPTLRNRNRIVKIFIRKNLKNRLEDCMCLVDPIEVSIGIHYGIRFGLNLDELIDLFAGLLTFDPMKDDLDEKGKYNWEYELENKRIKILQRFANLLLKEKKEKLNFEEKKFLVNLDRYYPNNSAFACEAIEGAIKDFDFEKASIEFFMLEYKKMKGIKLNRYEKERIKYFNSEHLYCYKQEVQDTNTLTEKLIIFSKINDKLLSNKRLTLFEQKFLDEIERK